MASETSAVNPTGGITLDDYTVGDFFDELIDEHGRSRPDAIQLVRMLNDLKVSELQRRQQAIERSLYNWASLSPFTVMTRGLRKLCPSTSSLGLFRRFCGIILRPGSSSVSAL